MKLKKFSLLKLFNFWVSLHSCDVFFVGHGKLSVLFFVVFRCGKLWRKKSLKIDKKGVKRYEKVVAVDNRNRRGGGGVNSQENFCVQVAENGLDKAKSFKLEAAKNTEKFSKFTSKNTLKNAKNNCVNNADVNRYNNKNIKSNSANNANVNLCSNKNINKNTKNNCINDDKNHSIYTFNNENVLDTNLYQQSQIKGSFDLNYKDTPDTKMFQWHKIRDALNIYDAKVVDINMYQQHQIKSFLSKSYKIVPDTKLHQVQNKLNTTNSPNSQNTLKIPLTQKIIAVVVSLALIISLLGSGTYFLVNHINNSRALDGTFSSIGDILKDGNTVEYSIYKALTDRLGSKTGQVGTIDGGTPIVFTMAGRDWQVVYRDPNNSDIITIWMTDYYTTAVFNASSLDGNNYNGSAIQSTVTSYYNTQKNSYPVLDKITVSPNQMSSTYKTAQDKEFTPSGWSYGSSTSTLSSYSDKFWLPSLYEAFSFWGLDNTDRTVSSGSCWLRSGYSFSSFSDRAMLVYSPDSASYDLVYNSNGVRPAAHLSLSAMLKTMPLTVILDRQNGTGGTTSVTATNGSAMPTITPPTRTGYTFGGFYTGINGTGTQYYKADGTSARNWDIVGDTTLYAYWIINKHSVTFNSNNPDYGTILNSGGSIDYGTTYIAGAVPKQNCAFLYWLDSSAPNAPIYDNPLTITVTSDKTYTAYFTNSLVEGVCITSSFGGSAEILQTVDTTTPTDSDTFTLIARLRYAGYKFDGWFVQGQSTAFSTEMSVSVQYGTIKNKIIIAKFSKINSNINTDTDNPDSGFV